MLSGLAYGYALGAPYAVGGLTVRAIEWVDVLEIDASLSTVPTARQNMLIDLVLEIVSPSAFGGETAKRTRMARCLLAAHFAVVFNQAASGAHSGPETSRTGLGISKSFGATAMSADGLSRSAHGQLYLMLVQSSPYIQGARA